MCSIVDVLKKYYEQNVNELTDSIKNEIQQSINELLVSIRVENIPDKIKIDEFVSDNRFEVSVDEENIDHIEAFRYFGLNILNIEEFQELKLRRWKEEFFSLLIGKNIQELLNDDEICDCIAKLYCFLGAIASNFYVTEWILLKGWIYNPKIISDEWLARIRREDRDLYEKEIVERAYNIQSDYVDMDYVTLKKLAQANDDMAFLENARRLMPYSFLGSINLNSIPNGLFIKTETPGQSEQRLGYHSLCCAANLGNVYALWILGVHLVYSTNAYEQFIGSKIFQRGAQYKDSYHEYMLGEVYERGLGVEKNIIEAKRWYLKSAKQGNHLAYCRHRILSLKKNMELCDIVGELPLGYDELK